jgi:hypothetical protein
MQNNHEIALVSNLITDTQGALKMLSERSKRAYSTDTLRYHVLKGHITAYVFVGVNLVPNAPGEKRRGQSYIFLKRDVLALPLESKVGRKPKQ